MKNFVKHLFISISAISLCSFPFASLAQNTLFDQEEVEQEKFVAIAAPSGFGPKLLILEQKTDQRECWAEDGDKPVIIDPLLVQFDFTGICGRATDSNGYSLRMGGRDLALNFSLSLQSIDGDLRLVAVSRVNPFSPPILIGRTQGLANGFTKIILEPGWRFAKRSYQGKVLGHIYLTTDVSVDQLQPASR